MLDRWRVLDLTGVQGEVGPYVLADLGAEVIRLVPPPAPVDPGRRSRDGGTDREHAYNANKSTAALTGDPDVDRSIVAGLVAGADLVFDAGPPGTLADLGLDRDELTAVNPRIVSVLVTPFGATGPRAEQPASELTIAALGGPVHLQGTRDRAPVQISVPQVWRHAGVEAAVAALIAHRRMTITGEAQFVDVSAQSVMTWTLLNAMEAYEIQGRDFQRNGSILHLSLPVQLRLDAADGHVVCVPTGRTMRYVLPWLIEDGIVGPEWAETDWELYDHRVIQGEPVAHTLTEVMEAIGELCRRYSRRELFLRGLDLGASLAPLNTLDDLLRFDHLAARRFWTTPDGAADATPSVLEGGPARRPGAFCRLDGARPAVERGRPIGPGPTVDGVDGARWTAPGRSAESPGRDGGGLPLEGLVVVDFSWIGVGPITAKCLADHGATVIRVESENRIDGLRRQPPYKNGEAGTNRSNFYGTFNTSKLGIELDLKSPAGLEVARRLVEGADVVVESFTPGTIDRLGLGYDAMVEANPALVMVSTSLLGEGSDVSRMAGYGYHAAAVAGFQGLVGWPDLPPDGPWLAYTDTIGPRFLATAVLAALDRRDRTGQGCHIEGAQLEMALQFLAPELSAYQRTGQLPPRRGNRSADVAPQGVYPVAGDDRWLAISVADDGAWARLVEVLGGPAWAADPELCTVAGRQAAHDLIDDELARWTAGRDGPATESLLAANGIAAGMVQASEQLLDDPQYRHRGFYRYLEHSEVGTVPYAGHQYRIDGYDHGPRRAAPCLGEHTYEVLTDICGYDSDEIADLAARGAMG